MIANKTSACLVALGMLAVGGVTSCGSLFPGSKQRVSRPLATDVNEVHWRMYYEDQFEGYGRAVPPGAGDPDVAWTAYYAEKQAQAVRDNNELLKEQLRLLKKKD